jgi:hypothetical protein
MKDKPKENLTKREMFAMAALQGILANPDNTGTVTTQIANMAVWYADELIRELEK